VTAVLDLPSTAFRREREASWKELDLLLAKIEASGIRSLTARELSDLPHLYRTALSSLSLARSISLDRNLVDYLESLATRGYFGVYGPPRRLASTLARFLLQDFPAAVRAHRWHVALAAAFLLAGAAVGWTMVGRDPDLFYSFVPDELAQGRDPGSSTEMLLSSVHGTDGGAAFATMLFTHNARVGILVFALGFAAGVPVFLLLVQNGVILGAFMALFHSRGLLGEFMAWVLPHGVTELLAIVFCGAGGLVLAHRLLLPGTRSRLDALAAGGRQAGTIATGAVTMLVLAALLEGIFRQAVQDLSQRYAVAAATSLFWIAYLALAGRRDAARGPA
jgi:uncharacterized membrane protein SpoIIM required for sporulation